MSDAQPADASEVDDRLDAIAHHVGAPYFADEGFVLFHGDCVQAMRSMPAGATDLTVTSPPYNIGKSYEGKQSLDEYVVWSREWMSEVHRVTAGNGAFWLNLGYTPLHPSGKAVPLAYLLWNLTDFHMIQEVVWNYGAGVAGRLFFSPRNEKFLWFVKNEADYVFNLDAVRDPDVKYPRQFKNGRLKVNPLGKNPTDVWQFAKVTSGFQRSSKERTGHPAQFPEGVIERVIKASSNVGDVIFDPFMGSGTSAVVGYRNDRLVVGSELDEKYCELAVNRYLSEKENRGNRLFGI
jgi:adenine-specific DNA-methyltransferase